MAHGRKLTVTEAVRFIKNFEDYEAGGDPAKIAQLGIGQKYDLSALKDFIAAIDKINANGDIDSVRIYLARSSRGAQQAENFDLVFVPVLKTDEDIHHVYDKKIDTPQDTLLGGGLPCPNICTKRNLISCP